MNNQSTHTTPTTQTPGLPMEAGPTTGTDTDTDMSTTKPTRTSTRKRATHTPIPVDMTLCPILLRLDLCSTDMVIGIRYDYITRQLRIHPFPFIRLTIQLT